MAGTQRAWSQPAHIVVREGWLRAFWGIGDDERLEDIDPQTLDAMVGEAILCAPEWSVEFDEDWREVEPEPYPRSDRCRCGHWLRLDSSYGDGHPPERPWDKDSSVGPCRVCGCDQPEREPDPPWVRQTSSENRAFSACEPGRGNRA
jgi:hypothetical protein